MMMDMTLLLLLLAAREVPARLSQNVSFRSSSSQLTPAAVSVAVAHSCLPVAIQSSRQLQEQRSMAAQAAVFSAAIELKKSHRSVINGVDVSPDSQRIASASDDFLAKTWSLGGEVLLSFQGTGGSSGALTSIDYSPDGSKLLCASYDSTVRVFDADTGKQLGKFAMEAEVRLARWDPNSEGTRFVCATRRHRPPITTALTLHDAVTGKLLSSFPLGKTADNTQVSGLRFSSSGALLAASFNDKTVHLFDVQSGKSIRVIAPRREATDVCFSPSGDLLALGLENPRDVVLYPVVGQSVRIGAGHKGTITSLCWSPCGRWLVSASEDRTIRVWRLGPGKIGSVDSRLASQPSQSSQPQDPMQTEESMQLQQVQQLDCRSAARCCRFAPNGAFLVAGGYAGIVSVWPNNVMNAHLRAWRRVAVSLAFMRANHQHPFRDSILALLPSIDRLCYDPWHAELTRPVT